MSKDLVKEIKSGKLSVEVDEADDKKVEHNLKQLRNISSVIKEALIEGDGKDYGNIPNLPNKKVLFQAGADKIITLFGLKIKYNLIEKEMTPKGWRIFMEAQLWTKGNEMISNAFAGHDPQSARDNSPANAFNLDRALKMTQKRAKVWAVKSIGGLSDTFVDDIGDEALRKIDCITSAQAIDIYKVIYQDKKIDKNEVKNILRQYIREWNASHEDKIVEITDLKKAEYKNFQEFIKER